MWKKRQDRLCTYIVALLCIRATSVATYSKVLYMSVCILAMVIQYANYISSAPYYIVNCLDLPCFPTLSS